MLTRLLVQRQLFVFSTRLMSSSLISQPAYKPFLNQLGLEEENLGVFDGQWFANGEVFSSSLFSVFPSSMFRSLILSVQRRMKSSLVFVKLLGKITNGLFNLLPKLFKSGQRFPRRNEEKLLDKLDKNSETIFNRWGNSCVFL